LRRPCEPTLYEGLYHEVLNEPEKDTVVDELLNWLVERS